MNNKKWSLFAILLTFVLILTACSGDSGSEKSGTEEEPEKKVDAAAFPLAVENNDKAIDGGTMNVALVNDSPFQGVFSLVLYEDGYDADIMEFASNTIFDTDGDFLITDTGIASMKVDAPNNKVTVKIREGVKWSDGEPLKIEDLIYAYEIIGHPEYTGVRNDGDFQNIVGAVEYTAGQAETISGLKKVDETTLEIQFKKLSPAIYNGGDGLWTGAEPYHYLKDVPVAQLEESDQVRKAPLSLGAYKYDNIVNGESVKFVANEHYWKGEPKIKEVILKNVPSTQIAKAIENGDYDYVMSFPTSQFEAVKDLDNITLLGRPELYYQYLGFKLGKYDAAKGEVVTDVAGSKMGDVKLRQAMGYAIDVEGISTEYFFDLRERANSLIPPVFSSFYDESLKGYTYDKEKAIEILDEAGYKDVDGDGLREDPNGEKLEIKFASMSGGDTEEAVASYYMQNWKDVGLNVTLTTGRTIEFQSFYDKVKADDPEIDVWLAAWGTGSNPSPSGLYGKESAFNYSRYSSDKLTELLTEIDSPKAIDAEYRAEKFTEWQEYMFNQAPVIPTQYRLELVPVSKRVKGINIDYAEPNNMHEWELTAEKAPASSK